MSDDLNDDAIEAYLSGQARDEPLGRLLASIGDHYASIPSPEPGPELSAIMAGEPPAVDDVVDRSITRRRRKRAVAAALTGTVVGKVMIGVSVAAASVAGMQATGIVQVPVLPGPHHDGLVSSDEPAPSTSTTPPTTSDAPAVEPDFSHLFPARDAGTVDLAVRDGAFVWVRPAPAEGWSHTLEQQPTDALVTFLGAAGSVDVHATIEGDRLHVVVVDHRDGSSEEFWLDDDGRPTAGPDQPVPPVAAADAGVQPTSTAPRQIGATDVDDSDSDDRDDDSDSDDHDDRDDDSDSDEPDDHDELDSDDEPDDHDDDSDSDESAGHDEPDSDDERDD